MMPKIAIVSMGVLLVSCSSAGHSVSDSQVAAIHSPIASSHSGWGGQSRVAGEYLITVSENVKLDTIALVYQQFGVKSVRKLGDVLYQINLEQDPGPEKIDEIGRKSNFIKATQPNYIYRTQ